MVDPAPRRSGVLIQWDDARGFGFIESADGGRRVFVHVSEYPAEAPRPMAGDELSFVIGAGADGRRQAREVEVLHSARLAQAAEEPRAGAPRRRGRVSILALIPVPIFVVLFFLVIARWEVPLWGIVIYPAMSLATFFLYLLDKRAALEGSWRVRENTLLVAGLLGGWPGAVIAQQVLRHKNRKWDFQAMFWCLTVLNVAIFILLVWYRGPIADFLRQL